ncbi:MAG: DUF222 domain-containing protein [Microbacterium sp.]
MTLLADALSDLEIELGAMVSELVGGAEAHSFDDQDVLATMAAAARLRCLSETILVEMAAQVDGRSARPIVDDRMTRRYGCRTVNELIQRTTLASARTVADVLRAARGIARSIAPSSGEVLAARYPELRRAAAEGALGIDGLASVVAALDAAVCSESARLAADVELAASARGVGSDGGPAPSADDLRTQATVWAMYLDQDGSEPRETRALRKRGVTLGACREGLVPVRCELLPEVAAQFERLCDSILNPKAGVAAGPFFVDSAGDEPFPVVADTRTVPQKRHDALAIVLSAAARSGELPTIGGGAPTLVVEVVAADLASGRGHAHLDGCDEPVSLAVARQVACSGSVQRVTSDSGGRILAIDVADRVFAAHQRKAIALRDGGCVIPGCHVSASWCEIHHAEEAARGGPTHTDNGVLLCWFHHRTLDSSGWHVRMRQGVPEVRGPAWWDSSGRWRPTTKSPLRMRSRLRA